MMAAKWMAATAGWAAAGGLIGLGIGSAMDPGEGELERSRQGMEASTNAYEEADRNLLRIEAGLGEGCLVLMRAYGPGGALADKDENTVVNDLIGDPEQACGGEPTAVRTDVVAFRAAHAELAESREGVATAEHEQTNDENDAKSPAEYYVFIGGLTAIGVGISQWWRVDSKRHKHGQMWWA